MTREFLPDGDYAFLRTKMRPARPSGAPIRIVDLFSGCGGMTLGAIEAARTIGRAAEIVLAMEKDKTIRAIYDANFESVVDDERGDVRKRFHRGIGKPMSLVERRTKRQIGQVDLLLGGPPCQGHSNLNNHTRRSDPKNALYLRMLRAVEVLEPTCVIIENVPTVRHASNGAVRTATELFETLGYRLREALVSAARFGVPQLRSRHVLLAARSGADLPESLLADYEIEDVRDLRWAIGDLEDEVLPGMFGPSKLSPENEERARYLLRYKQYDLPNKRRPTCHKTKPNHKYKSMYGRLAWNAPAQTVTTGFGSPGQGRYLHPSRLRALTPHEAARLQFFPDWFDFSAAKIRRDLRLSIGNAVPPKLAFVLSLALLRHVSAHAVALDEPRAAS
jgi:DNA (cytosine-5)-methyltransferase 1